MRISDWSSAVCSSDLEAQLIDIRVELLADLGVCAVLHDAAVGREIDLLSHGSPPLPLSPCRQPPPLSARAEPPETSRLPGEPAGSRKGSHHRAGQAPAHGVQTKQLEIT